MATKKSGKEILQEWMGPEEITYMPGQISIRLPVLVAAKIAALCELFPKKSKSEPVELGGTEFLVHPYST